MHEAPIDRRRAMANLTLPTTTTLLATVLAPLLASQAETPSKPVDETQKQARRTLELSAIPRRKP